MSGGAIRTFALSAGIAVALVACSEQAPTGLSQSLSKSGQVCNDVVRNFELALRKNFLTEYPEAEIALAQVARAYDNPDNREALANCPGAKPEAIIHATRALVMSNQRNFQQADGMLELAQRALEQEKEGPNKTQIRDYSLLHAVNRASIADQELDKIAVTVDAGSKERAASLDLPQASNPNEAAASVVQMLPEEQIAIIRDSVEMFTLSAAYLDQGRFEEAEARINRALAGIQAVPVAYTSFRPRFQAQKALIVLERGKVEEADALISAALDPDQGYGPDMRGTALEGRAGIVQSRVRLRAGDEVGALAASDAAMEAFSRTTVPVTYGIFYQHFSLAKRRLSQTSDPAERERLHDSIFVAAQLVRSQLTASSVSAAASSRFAGNQALANAVKAYNAAEERVAQLNSRRVAVQSGGLSQASNTAQFLKEVDAAEEARTAARSAVELIEPDYFSQRGEATTRAALQEALAGDDEVFIQVIVGEPHAVVLFVAKDDIQFYEVDNVSTVDLIKDVDDLRTGLQEPRYEDIGYQRFEPNRAHSVYQTLFGRLQSRLADRSRIVFSLTGALSTFPMEALALERSEIPDSARTTAFEDVAWLGRKYEVTYVPSPRNLVELRKRAVGTLVAAPKIAAFGGFYQGFDVQRALEKLSLPQSDQCIQEALYIAEAPELEGTWEEIAHVLRIFGEDSLAFAGEDFTEARIQQESAAGTFDDVSVLHFATHGVLPQEHCMRAPGLTVTVPPGVASDGLLTDSEIFDLNLRNVDLVVLTACDTARREEELESSISPAGDGLAGLARAFFGAGSKAVMATHWPITDTETVFFVEQFYVSLRAGERFSRAHQLAQAALRDDPYTSDPHYWAPFVLIGDAQRQLSPL